MMVYQSEVIIMKMLSFDGTRPISDLDSSVNGGQWSTHTTNIITDTNQTLSNKTIYKIKLNSNVEIWTFS